MLFTMERIAKILKELYDYAFSGEMALTDFQYKEGNYSGIVEVDNSPDSWHNFQPGTRWGGRNKYRWFRTKLIIPKQFDGKTVALRIATTEEKNLWDATNPQFLLYINGELFQGLDVNHQEAILGRPVKSGTVYQIDLHAFGGMEDRQVDFFASLLCVDELVKKVYYNFFVPFQVAQCLSQDDHRRQKILTVLNEAINRLDLREPFSKEFYDALLVADDYFSRELFDKLKTVEEATATCIGHSHIDLAWLWTLDQTREKVARSFATALKLMEEYHEFIFISSQPQLYQFVKEDHPELYAKIIARIKEGRWEPEGAMWVESDCNLIAGESLVRQILFGKRFFKEEFGIDSQLLWLPDSFGFSPVLPQIMQKSGVRYLITSKLSWNEFNKMPYDTFMWQGIDGSEVLVYFITTRDPRFGWDSYRTTYNGKLIPEAIIGGWQRYQQKNLNTDILVAYGYGDGGGGPTTEMLENASRMEKAIPGCPRVKLGKAGDYFQRLAERLRGREALPKWVGELYLEYHRGTYTSMGRNKRYNRKSELLYQDAEFLAVCSLLLLGSEYPQKAINQGWKLILLNQFHDILPGSAIKEVYETSREQYELILAEGRKVVEESITRLASNIELENPAWVIFNTLSFERDEIVTVELPEDITCSCILDDEGRKLPLQRLEGNRRQAIFLAKRVPAKGYRIYYPSVEPAVAPAELSVSLSKLENRYFSVELDAKGTLSSCYDKVNQREILKPGERGNRLQAFEDKPFEFDNWNIDLYYHEKEWEIDTVEEIKIVEQGPVRSGIQIRKRFLNSEIIQTVYIYQDLPRIDFDTEIDWKENQILLKAAFPLDIHNTTATYEIQFGCVERATHWNTSWDMARFEVFAHKWVDLSESGYGVSLLNDCKYGHDIKDGVVRLTLLKSGNYPNPEADRERHRFCYSLYPHAGGWREGGTVPMAYSLNVPMYAKWETPHPGKLPRKLSMFSLDQGNIVLETVKKAEDSMAIIIRLYESQNRRCRVRLSCHQPIRRVVECSLMEEDLAELPVDDVGFSFEIKPYEIKTFKLEMKGGL